MKECVFEYVQGGIQCIKCGKIIWGNPPLHGKVKCEIETIGPPEPPSEATTRSKPHPKQKRPSIVQMAKNVVGAAVDAVKDGGKLVSPEEKQRRLDICGGCEHYRENRCDLCGCHMNLKTRLNSAHCPINKW